MSWKRTVGCGVALWLGTGMAALAQSTVHVIPASPTTTISETRIVMQGQPAPMPTVPGTPAPASGDTATVMSDAAPAEAPPEGPSYGPTPLPKVGILQHLIYGDDADKAKLKFMGWADFDYTYRSTGHGVNNIAPVINRFGDEAPGRQLGLYISKPLAPKDWSWGFNSIFIAGSDAS